MAHDVAVPCVAEELEGEQGAQGAGGGDHGAAGELSAAKNGVESARYEIGEEEKEAAKLRVQRSWAEVELLHVGDVGLLGLGPGRSLLVEPSRQTRETFVAQDLIDGDRTDGNALMVQGSANVVDGEVLLAQDDDALAQFVALLLVFDRLRSWGKEIALGILTELMDEPAKAAGGIAEPLGRFLRGKALDEVSAESLVLALAGVFGLEEVRGEC
jgi:hypothetical protein